MKKLIALALIAGLLTSCEENTTSEPSPEAIGVLSTINGFSAHGSLAPRQHEITDYSISGIGILRATTTKGEKIVTNIYTLILNEKH